MPDKVKHHSAEPFGVSAEELFRAVQISDLYTALARLGAPPDLLAKIESCAEGLDDGKLLALVRIWNADGEIVLDKIPPLGPPADGD